MPLPPLPLPPLPPLPLLPVVGAPATLCAVSRLLRLRLPTARMAAARLLGQVNM